MFRKIIFSLALGVIAALYFAQNDQWVHDALKNKLRHALTQALACTIEFEIESVNIFVPSITLKNVQCSPDTSANGQNCSSWHWKAQHLTLRCSWITFALSSIIGLHIDIDTADVNTLIQDSKIALLHDHILKFIDGPPLDIPLYVRSITFATSTVRLHHPETNADLMIQWSSQTKSIDGVFKTNLYVHDGSFYLGSVHRLDRLQGDLNLNFIPTVRGLKIEALVNCFAQVYGINAHGIPCAITGSWHTDHGDFAIESDDKKLMINPLKIELANDGVVVEAQGHAPLDTLGLLFSDIFVDRLTGDCELGMNAVWNAQQQAAQGHCTLQNVTYKDAVVANNACINFNYSPANNLNGQLSFEYEPIGKINGSWQANLHTKTACVKLENSQSLNIPGFSKWKIDDHKFSLDACLDANGVIQAGYTIIAHNPLTNNRIQSHGKIGWDNKHLECGGEVNHSEYTCTLGFNPTLSLEKLFYKNAQETVLLDIESSTSDIGQFQGSIDIGLLRSVSQYFAQYDIQGEGHIGVKGSIANSSIVHLNTTLQDGLIRLPQTYNFINACDAHIVCDTVQKNITVQDLHIGLHRGSIDSPRIIIQADDALNVRYAYAPFVFDSCLFTMKKDLFALFSGTLAVSKKYDQLPHAKGSFIIERSYVKENVYSTAFQKSITGFTYLMVDTKKQDMSCDITLETKEPIRVDTAFLEATAKVLLHITNTVRDPKLAGSIEIISGSLAFPYKPLLITKGSIYFMPDQLFDPLIELVAKNKIKNYNVGLQVTGSLLNHDISLESSPPLTDEQIIALLLVGSQEQSLSVVVPALVMQNLKLLLLDSEQSPLKLNNFFKSWLKPFKNINLVPSFGDQTGRGGLRGAIEIEMSDRWRAMAQKNFSLSEDTRFEVEYSLSDDITLRGIRNERKDVAGEVEMRWKFGR